MFKFNFQENQSSDNIDSLANDVNPPAALEAEGKEINFSQLHSERADQFSKYCFPTTGHQYQLIDFKQVEELLSSKEEAVEDTGLSAAIKLNSDVVKGVYEGGMKIWECTLDLLNYIQTENIDFENKKVLDLGCGAGLLGIQVLRNGASPVHFQDYNLEVIDLITIPNVLLNTSDEQAKKCKYFSGDWGLVLSHLETYDVILTSETIYNVESYSKLVNIFDKVLNQDGFIYLAAKTHYFGVGGNLRQFEKFLKDQKTWETQLVFNSEEGVRREILKISKIK